MFCPKCGKEAASADKFCKECGQALAGSAPAPESVDIRNPRVGKNQQLYGFGLVFLGVLLLVRAFAGEGRSDFLFFVGALTVIAGVVVYAVGRFEHWYHAE